MKYISDNNTTTICLQISFSERGGEAFCGLSLPQPIKGKSNNRKNMKKLFTLLFASLAVFAFVACDDDNDSGSSASSSSIVGTWYHYDYEEGSFYSWTLVFYGVEFELYEIEADGHKSYSHGTYLYIPERNFLQLDYGDGDQENYWISVDGDRMTLRYRDETDGLESPEVFTRQK